MRSLSSYKILVFREVLDWIKKQKDKKVEEDFDRGFEKLRVDPYAGKRLHGPLSGKFSLRQGKIRIIYVIDERNKTVRILAVGWRKKIYKRFQSE